MAPFVDACSHFLHASFTLPAKLDSKWAAFDHAGPSGSQQFSCFRRCTGHQVMPIPISYIHKHGGYKPSFRSKMLLTSVDMAFYSIHTFQRPPPGSTNGVCCLSPGSAAR